MKKLFIPLILLLCTVAFFSCSKSNNVVVEPVEVKRPLAAYTIAAGDDPFTFVFTNASSNYKTIEWRFGDDSLSAEVSPTHQYYKPGIYEVNLKTTSEDGSTARKLLVINIKATDLVQFVAPKTAANTVKFNITTSLAVQSVLWKFGDNTTSTELSPTKTYSAGFFGVATLTLTTVKGSVVTITNVITSEGTLSPSLFASYPGVVMVSHQSNTSGGELFEKLYDGNTNTKFLTTFNNSTNRFWMQWIADDPIVADYYTFTSANDASDRDPKKWNLQGSMDGITFVTLNEQSNQTFSSRFQTKLYSFSNTVAYKYYRINMLENNGGGLFQMAEWAMYKAK